MDSSLYYENGEEMCYSDIDVSDSSSSLEDKLYIRVSTAPARPLNELEEFKRSTEFFVLEQIMLCSAQLIHKDYEKLDLDSTEGQRICKKYMGLIEKLCEVDSKLNQVYDVNTASREYRKEFSKAYKILYKEGNLCYLTEILDSAQEAFPYLWVNGEKYLFSKDVLSAGSTLLASFSRLQNILRNVYSRVCQESLEFDSNIVKGEISTSLEEFDMSWTSFEKIYVNELMMIEKDARRFIYKAIELEKELWSIEIREKMKGRIILNNSDYHNQRGKLCKIIGEINSVANERGKGRDDLEFDILLQAEGLLRRISTEQSKAIRNLAEQIRNSFQKLRTLFRKYESNIEVVDPQLKNNSDLVEALENYEAVWEKGKNYFIDGKKCNYLLHFSHMIEATGEKYSDFQEQIECREADIFMTIPCLLILKYLNKEDKDISKYFLPDLEDENSKNAPILQSLKDLYEIWKQSFKTKSYEYYNTLEKMILNVSLNPQEKDHVACHKELLEQIQQKIKMLSMEMQRFNPMEWNDFLDASLLS